MSIQLFYREQATQQQTAADAATLANVRDRCQRAADAWTDLAVRGERVATGQAERTAQTLSDRLARNLNENPDRGRARA